MWEIILPILINRVLVPEIAKVVRANPTITDADILTKLPTDVAALATSNQSYLDSIRTAAGR